MLCFYTKTDSDSVGVKVRTVPWITLSQFWTEDGECDDIPDKRVGTAPYLTLI